MSGEPFDSLVDRYERWFSEGPGRALFPAELEAVRRVAWGAPGPWIEVGAGTGVFARALGVNLGIDPSWLMLTRACDRGVLVAQGVAEALPLRDGSAGTIFLITTLCFLSDARRALREAKYALMPGGSLVVAEIPRDSPWGRLYEEKGRAGSPFYADAKFYTVRETVAMLRAERFRVEAFASTLLQPPSDAPSPEAAHDGVVPGVSFVALRAVRG